MIPMSSVTRPAAPAGRQRKLPLRKRPDLQARPIAFQGRRHWNIKDPVALRYYQLRDEEYAILEMLDGQTSAKQIQTAFEQRFAPRRLALRELEALLGTLHQEGLIVADTPGQGESLLARHDQARRRRRLQAIANLLAMRFRGVDPEPLLGWLYPKCRWLFSRWCLLLGVLLVLAAAGLVLVKFDSFQAQLPEFHAFFNAHNIVWLAMAVVLAKVLHELAHALVCKHFGGECHELGIMLLVFMPCLYCNVSDAWMLANKWHRVAISGAGIAAEVVMAAICTLLWWSSEPGLFNSVCLNLMFVCSVSTVVFNGNPLLRYDGYYVLSDIVEVPNLHQQAASVAHSAGARWGLGIDRPLARLLPGRGHGWLGIYWIASTAYRWAVVLAIAWLLSQALKPYRLELLGRAIALAAVAVMVAGPAWKVFSFLRRAADERRLKPGRVLVRGGALAAAATALLLVPLPYRVSAPVVLEPRQARRVYVPVPGLLMESLSEGAKVRQGQTVARLENLELSAEVARLQGEQNQQRRHVWNLQSRRIDDPPAGSQLPAAKEALADIEARLRQRQTDQERLCLTAPVAGTVMPPPRQPARHAAGELSKWSGSPLDRRNAGSFLETGTTFCLVGDPQQMDALIVADQSIVDFLRIGQRVRIRLDQFPGQTLWGTINQIAEIDLKIAPRELAGSGGLPVQTDEQGVPRPRRTSYQARVVLDDHHAQLLAGASGRAKIHVDAQSLARRAYRFLAQTFRLEL